MLSYLHGTRHMGPLERRAPCPTAPAALRPGVRPRRQAFKSAGVAPAREDCTQYTDELDRDGLNSPIETQKQCRIP